VKLNKEKFEGHSLALFTMLVWGTTYISTKVLLESFEPVDVLVIRFVISFVILLIAAPKKIDHSDKKRELYFLGAGLSGICMYYLLENISLKYTTASNVGVIVSTAPFFTAILSRLLKRIDKLKVKFFIGFIVAMVGIALISFQGAGIEWNPKGDLLAVLSAFMWAVYSQFTDKIGSYDDINTIQATRHVFFYGILFMIPTCLFMGVHVDFATFFLTKNLLNMLYLGLVAGAVCFVTWQNAVKRIGALASNVYIYTIPVITVITSAIVLHEKITPYTVAGIILVLAGLVLSK